MSDGPDYRHLEAIAAFCGQRGTPCDHLDERAGVARFDAVSPTRMTSEWLGLEETELSRVPERVIEAIALRLTRTDPEATLREELLGRLLPITVSVGWGVDGTTGDAPSLVAAADASLYAAKNRGHAGR